MVNGNSKVYTALAHPDRLFPTEEGVRRMARELYEQVKDLPLICPHGHTDPWWFAENQPFADPVSLLLTPDHYLLRMFYSQGIDLEQMGVRSRSGASADHSKENPEGTIPSPREIWHTFAENFYLFRGTPSSLWLNQMFQDIFGMDQKLSSATADLYFDAIGEKLNSPEFLPRSLFERFKIEVLCTTDSAVDDLKPHQMIRKSGWPGHVIPCFRPDSVLDPDHERFTNDLRTLEEITGENVESYRGYIRALEKRREFFRSLGATSTDHGPETPETLWLSSDEAEKLYVKCRMNSASAIERVAFRAHMLCEMARMSHEDGMVMQIHAGSFRNHNKKLFASHGRDIGADIPQQVEFTRNLKPLLDQFGNSKKLSIILFTLDETNYSRELAPLVGHYPVLKMGPSWWFHDSPEGMRRFREQMIETAGFYNTVGFNDDTRAFLSIPARHDLARRVDCSVVAKWVAEHRLDEQEAAEIVVDLAYNLAKKSYKL